MKNTLFTCLLLPLWALSVPAEAADKTKPPGDLEGIAIWGHSMVSDLSVPRLQPALHAVGAARPDRPIFNMAIGGSGCITSLVRMGALTLSAEVVGGVIPAAGPVELVNIQSETIEKLAGDEAGKRILQSIRWTTFWPDGDPRARLRTWVTIQNVYGQLFSQGKDPKSAQIFFQRRDPGEATPAKDRSDIRVIALGERAEHAVADLSRQLTIWWPEGIGENTVFYPEIYGKSAKTDGYESVLQSKKDISAALIRLVLSHLSSSEKRALFLEGMPYTMAASSSLGEQANRLHIENASTLFTTEFNGIYFDYRQASLAGLGSVPPAKAWLEKNHPAIFSDPIKGWQADFAVMPEGMKDPGSFHTGVEPAAVAALKIVEAGGSGVVAAPDVPATYPESTRWIRAGLVVGVEAQAGVATNLTVREGGRGYAVGDRVTIPAGAIGNAAPIVAEVVALREETIGTVRLPDGSIDLDKSFSQWDVDNGFWPRCLRRDRIHFTPEGAEYLSQLVAAEIARRGW